MHAQLLNPGDIVEVIKWYGDPSMVGAKAQVTAINYRFDGIAVIWFDKNPTHTGQDTF